MSPSPRYRPPRYEPEVRKESFRKTSNKIILSRVITFSRTFPSYHPKAGQSTYFVEKIWEGLGGYWSDSSKPELHDNVLNFIRRDSSIIWPKHHTIRAGHRWKEGDWFSPRVWSGQPYNSKQIIIAPDIQVKKVWYFDAEGTDFYLSGRHEYTTDTGFDFSELEKNDGLSPGDLFDWICLSPEYKKSNKFNGQIICWNENVNY